MVTAAATVLTGTLYPLVLETISGSRISVGAPYFNLTFIPLIIPLLIAVPFGPLLSWKRGDLYACIQRLYTAFAAALLATIVTFSFISDQPVLAILGIGVAFWLMVGSFSEIVLRAGFAKNGLGHGWRRIWSLPGSIWATALAHFGTGVTLLGIVCVTAFQSEKITQIKPGEHIKISGYSLSFDAIRPGKGPNFVEDVAIFSVRQGGVKLREMHPAKRFYTTRNVPTTESAIASFGFSQLYIALGEIDKSGTILVRVWWKPWVLLIWIGAIFMVVAALLSLGSRWVRSGIFFSRLPLKIPGEQVK